jgi:hypothetical protein
MGRMLFFGVFLACSSGCFAGNRFLNRTDGIARMQAPAAPEVDAEIAKVQALRPQASFPCRIAVHLAPSTGSWRWTPADKAILDDVGRQLKAQGVATDVFAMSAMTIPSGDKGVDFHGLRVAAAKHGADLLLVIQGSGQSNTTKNALWPSTLTVLGGFVVPGTTCDATFTVAASAIDVRNGFLYAGVDAEEEATIHRPSFTLEESVAVEKAKKKALDQYGTALVERLVAMKEAFGR